MFCGNCGTQNDDRSMFCAGCGAKLNPQPAAPAAPVSEVPPAYNPYAQQPAPQQTPVYNAPQQAPAYNPYGQQPAYEAPANPYAQQPTYNPYGAPQQPAPKKSPVLWIILGVVAVAVAIVLILCLGGNSPEKLGKQIVKCFEKGDGEALMKLFHDDVIEEEIGDKDDVQDYIEDFEEGCEMMEEYGVSYKFIGTEDVDKDDLADIKEYYDDEYDLKVKDAAIVIIEMSIEFMGYEESEEMEIYVVKIGNKWYVDTDF